MSGPAPTARSRAETFLPESRGRVLIIAETRSSGEDLRQILRADHAVEVATGDLQAYRLGEQTFDVVLVDSSIAPGARSKLIEDLRTRDDANTTPIIQVFSRAENEKPDATADDCLGRPFTPRELEARVRTQLELARIRREAAELVRDSEARFRHVADQSPLMFWVTAPAGRCSYLNQRWYEYTGQTEDEALGFGWLDALHGEDRPRVKEAFLTSNARQRMFRSEYRLRRHDGAFRWMLDSVAPRIIDGKFAGYVGSVIDITDEREERQKLSREHTQMEMALRAGRIGTFEWDIPTGRIMWSPELESLYGLPAGAFEHSYRGWAQRVVPEDVARVERTVQRCFEQKLKEAEYEFRIILPDGSLRWLEGKARFVFAPNGAPRQMIGINLDIDDRKRTELHIGFISRLNQEVALLSDPHVILSTVSREMGRHLGASRCYFLTTSDAAANVVVEQDWVRDAVEPSLVGTYPIATFAASEIWRNVITRTVAIEDVTKSPITSASVAKYASLRMASWASAPFMRDGRWVASLVVASDRPRHWRADEIQILEAVLARVWPLVERARSEQAVAAAEVRIRESEERLRITVEAARLGTWDINPQTGEMVWDARGKELFGLPADAVVTWDRVIAGIHPEDQDAIKAAVERALTNPHDGHYDIEARTLPEKGAVRWVRSCGKAFFDAHGKPTRFIGTVLDITDVVKARETLADRRTELERIVAERTRRLQDTLAELEGFSYSISHDLRAPLRAMQTFAHILAEECSDVLNPACRDYLRRIVNASQRMDRLIHDVLVYSQVSGHELQLEPVNLESLIDGIVESYPQIQPSAADIIISRPLPHVLGNEAALTQCFSNLLTNAVKFVAPGVRPRIEIWAETAAKRVRLHVRDNGIGIAADAHERIFGIFERLSRDYEGTGIGLAVVRKAAERMGGCVSVTSQPGAGSTFCIELAGV